MIFPFRNNFNVFASICWILIVTISLGMISDPIHAEAQSNVPTLSSENVEKGMTGYGKTVFQGQKIDTFSVEVLGVIENSMPDQDMILVKASHPILESTQVMSGMSGSPVYINGRLIGALAYSWKFAKEPIAGITPIENIFNANRETSSGDGPGQGERLRSLLATSGFQGRYQKAFEEKFAEMGFPVQTTATGSVSTEEQDSYPSEVNFDPGDALGIQLMKGDLSITAIGTVTHVKDDEVYAFGHPFMNAGDIEFPMSTAEIHIPMPSVRTSFKLSSPVQAVGSIQEDRQSAIVGKTGQKPDMLSVNLQLETHDGSFLENYGVQVVRNQYLTPQLISSAASNFASKKINQLGLNRVESRVKLNLENAENIILRSSNVVSGGFDPWVFLPLSNLWMNPFRDIDVSSVDIDMTMKPEIEAARIKDLWMGDNTLRPGEKTTVYVQLDPYRGQPITRSVQFKLPSDVRGDRARLHAVPGSTLQGLKAEPESFDQVVDYINATRLDSELGIVLQVPELSLNASGHRLENLPYSVTGTFQRSSRTRSEFRIGDLLETLATDWVLEDSQSLTVPIRNN